MRILPPVPSIADGASAPSLQLCTHNQHKKERDAGAPRSEVLVAGAGFETATIGL
jgi:hypothetical protein